MKKYYKLIIGTDSIPYLSYPCDDAGKVLNPKLELVEYAFSKGCSVLDISHLDYIPAKLSTFDPVSGVFTAPEGEEHIPADPVKHPKHFAYMLDNTYYGGILVHPEGQSPLGEAIIAALSSNPVIVIDRIEL